jgi:hypothetical protein
LPPSFGSAYVGETFACTLSANNELPDDETSRVVTSVRIVAEMQTPSQVASLDLEPADDPAQTEGLQKGQSLQKIVRFDLKEEGNHILAVSISYTETLIGSDAQAASGRVRTFRKLYQFVAQPCLSVRTKSSELAPLEVENKSLGPYGKTRLLRFALEAQLENVGDGTVVVKVCEGGILPDSTISDCKIAHETQSQTALQSRFLELGPGEAGQGRLPAAHAEPTGCTAGCILS